MAEQLKQLFTEYADALDGYEQRASQENGARIAETEEAIQDFLEDNPAYRRVVMRPSSRHAMRLAEDWDGTPLE